ncbi:hypothetical protein OJJOAM_003180 [Cupriavidus sp. H18C1]
MQFLWPQMLWLLLALPLLAAAYLYVIARRKKAALLYASIALPRAALGRKQRVRRHIPPFLVLLGLGVALLACARPTATITLPSDTVTVVLAMDASRSMAAADVAPTRIAAAQHAARDFIIGLPASVRLGIVSFAATATVVLSPTESRQDMLDAIDRFQLQHGTATGSGLIQALAVLLPNDGIDLESIIFGGESLAPRTGRQVAVRSRRGRGRPQARTGTALGQPWLLSARRNHPAQRWPPHHRPGPSRRRTHGRTARRAGLHRGLRYAARGGRGAARNFFACAIG